MLKITFKQATLYLVNPFYYSSLTVKGKPSHTALDTLQEKKQTESGLKLLKTISCVMENVVKTNPNLPLNVFLF